MRPSTTIGARLGGAAAIALVAVLGTLTVERYLPSPTAAPEGLTQAAMSPDANPLTAAPSDEKRVPPIEKPPPDASSLEPASTVPLGDESRAPAPAEKPPAVLSATPPPARRRINWESVQRAIKRKADDLNRCVSDVYVSIGVHVAQGHVTLTSINGKPASLNLPHHRCVHDVVAPLRFPKGTAIDGVVGVPLEVVRTRTG